MRHHDKYYRLSIHDPNSILLLERSQLISSIAEFSSGKNTENCRKL